jgi:iron complex transport system permease protein
MTNNRPRFSFGLMILGFIFVLAFILNLSLGSVIIPFESIWKVISGQSTDSSAYYILVDYRLPKAFAALTVGGSLALSGLIMQTFFRNPLAGPFVLGISSGASLGVAVLFFGSSIFLGGVAFQNLSHLSIILASSAGSAVVFGIILTVALRLKDVMGLLIVGLMLGSFTAAIVTILSNFSSAEALQRYVFWTYGSLGNINPTELNYMIAFVALGSGGALWLGKSLNGLLMGESYAKSMGVAVKKTRTLLLVITSLLAGASTAFAGPIGFVGLAVPHLVRLLIPTGDHRTLIPAVLMTGGTLLLLCDTLSQLPGFEGTLPINGVTSLIGAPILVSLILSKRKILM